MKKISSFILASLLVFNSFLPSILLDNNNTGDLVWAAYSGPYDIKVQKAIHTVGSGYIDYQINYVNASWWLLTEISIKDNFSTGLSFSGIVNSNPVVTTTYIDPVNPRTVYFQGMSLNPEQTGSVIARFMIASGASLNSLNNTATVSVESAICDTFVTGSYSATNTQYVQPSTSLTSTAPYDMVVAASNSVATVDNWNNLTRTIQYCYNPTDGSTKNNVYFEDIFPTEFDYISVSSHPSPQTILNGSSPRKLIRRDIAMAPGECKNMVITYKAKTLSSPSVFNSFVGSTDANGFGYIEWWANWESNSTNNNDIDPIDLTAPFDLGITKVIYAKNAITCSTQWWSANCSVWTWGDEVTYRLSYTLSGPARTDISILDVMEWSQKFLSASLNPVNYVPSTNTILSLWANIPQTSPAYSSDYLIRTWLSLTNGQTKDIDVTLRLPSCGSTINNKAFISLNSPLGKPWVIMPHDRSVLPTNTGVLYLNAATCGATCTSTREQNASNNTSTTTSLTMNTCWSSPSAVMDLIANSVITDDADGIVYPGQEITYTFNYTNSGARRWYIYVDNTFDPNLEYIETLSTPNIIKIRDSPLWDYWMTTHIDSNISLIENELTGARMNLSNVISNIPYYSNRWGIETTTKSYGVTGSIALYCMSQTLAVLNESLAVAKYARSIFQPAYQSLVAGGQSKIDALISAMSTTSTSVRSYITSRNLPAIADEHKICITEWYKNYYITQWYSSSAALSTAQSEAQTYVNAMTTSWSYAYYRNILVYAANLGVPNLLPWGNANSHYINVVNAWHNANQFSDYRNNSSYYQGNANNYLRSALRGNSNNITPLQLSNTYLLLNIPSYVGLSSLIDIINPTNAGSVDADWNQWYQIFYMANILSKFNPGNTIKSQLSDIYRDENMGFYYPIINKDSFAKVWTKYATYAEALIYAAGPLQDGNKYFLNANEYIYAGHPIPSIVWSQASRWASVNPFILEANESGSMKVKYRVKSSAPIWSILTTTWAIGNTDNSAGMIRNATVLGTNLYSEYGNYAFKYDESVIPNTIIIGNSGYELWTYVATPLIGGGIFQWRNNGEPMVRYVTETIPWGNNFASANVTVAALPNIDYNISQSVQAGPYSIGQTLTFSYQVCNDGDNMDSAKVFLTLSGWLNYLSNSAWYPASISNGIVTLDIPNVSMGTCINFTTQTQISTNYAGGSLTSIAQINAVLNGSVMPDLTIANNSTPLNITVPAGPVPPAIPALITPITKTARVVSGSGQRWSVLEYTIVATNPLTGATTFAIIDARGTGLINPTIISNGTLAAWIINTATKTITRSAPLAINQSATVKIQFAIDTGTVNRQALINNAELINVTTKNCFDGDIVTGNNVATVWSASLGQIDGYVYYDKANNNLKDGIDTGVVSQLVVLNGTDILGRAISLTGSTNASGYYSFPNLLAGSYSVNYVNSSTYIPDSVQTGTNALWASTPSITQITNIILE
jgi:hypothetical protein